MGEYWTLTAVQILRVASEWLNSNCLETGLEIKDEWNISDYWTLIAEPDFILAKPVEFLAHTNLVASFCESSITWLAKHFLLYMKEPCQAKYLEYINPLRC